MEQKEIDNQAKKRQIDVQVEAQEIENERKRLEVFEKRVNLAKELGATEEDLSRLFRGLVIRPLKQLEQYDDIIDSIEIKPADEERESRV